MLNTEDFIKRLEHLMEYYTLSASAFADKISVQRSSISHLLSGRNKPSLDFVLKISEEFPDVDLYWLLRGKAPFLKSSTPTISSEKSNSDETNIDTQIPFSGKNDIKPEPQNSIPENIISSKSKNGIQKIVIFYSDGTFQDFNPTNS